MNADEPIFVDGKPTSFRDNFLLDWGLESWKKSLERLADALQRLVTLNVGLLGGSVVFLKDDVCTGWGRALAFACLLFSLFASLHGSLPKTYEVDLGQPAEIERQKLNIGLFRERWLYRASVGLWAGLGFAALGAVIKLLG